MSTSNYGSDDVEVLVGTSTGTGTSNNDMKNQQQQQQGRRRLHNKRQPKHKSSLSYTKIITIGIIILFIFIFGSILCMYILLVNNENENNNNTNNNNNLFNMNIRTLDTLSKIIPKTTTTTKTSTGTDEIQKQLNTLSKHNNKLNHKDLELESQRLDTILQQQQQQQQQQNTAREEISSKSKLNQQQQQDIDTLYNPNERKSINYIQYNPQERQLSNNDKQKLLYQPIYNTITTYNQKIYRWNTNYIHHTNNKINTYLPSEYDNDNDNENESSKTTTTTKTKRNETIIDMRILNQQLQFDNPDGGLWKQGFQTHPRLLYNNNNNNNDNNKGTHGTRTDTSTTDPLRIWVVPHSHCDPGWIKTFDEYFKTQTTNIISSIIHSLSIDKRRKFIWAEISYFSWWYNDDASDNEKQLAHQLIQNKQLEFVTGGWVQPDEANSELYAMEIQLQEGHDWINNTFGEQYIPKYGWSIDPFGYSSTAAFLWKQYNIQAILIQRVHYTIKKYLAVHQHFEFYWRQTWDDTIYKSKNNTTTTTATSNSNSNSNTRTGTTRDYDIYTHVMPFYSYDIPHTCGPEPSICCQFDFARLRGGTMSCPWNQQPIEINTNNVHERSMLLLDQYLKKASLYRHNAVLIPLGDDFRYQTIQETEVQYNNYQTIFDYINTNVPGVRIEFGTLSNYFDYVLMKQKEQELYHPEIPVPILKGNFFTYSDVNEDYWSGYFTSRVFDKALDRQLERILYSAETFTNTYNRTNIKIQSVRRALSLFQHHDGVTGTAKNHVVTDYAKRLYDSIHTIQQFIINQLVQSAAAAAEKQQLLPVVQSSAGTIMTNTTTTILNIGSKDISTINFKNIRPCYIADGPRSSFTTNRCGSDKTVVAYNPLLVEQTCSNSNTIIPPRQFQLVNLPCEIPGPTKIHVPSSSSSSSGTTFKFDPITGMMTHPIKEEWMVWKVNSGGAYLFVPGTLVSYLNDIRNTQDDPIIIENNGFVVRTKYWKRTIIQKDIPSFLVNGTSSSDTLHTINVTVLDFIFETNLLQDNNEWLVRVGSNSNNEIQNDGVFYTDMNGFNFDKHIFRTDMPKQSQVYPMPTVSCIQDKYTRLTIISEHAQGTASMINGHIDIWLDRRLSQDDNRGLGQGVQDNRPTQTRLRFVLEQSSVAGGTTTTTPIEIFDIHAEFDVTNVTQYMWDTLQHPIEFYGNHVI